MTYLYNGAAVLAALRRLIHQAASAVHLPAFAPRLIIVFGTASLLFLFISVSAMFLVWWERKVSAHMQSRLGPMRVGWHGVLQSIADAIKLLLKEDIVPEGADKVVHLLAPLTVMVSAFLAYAVLPFGPGLVAVNLNVGVLYVMAVTSLGVVGIVMAGYGSNNKYSLLGGLRSAAQIVSYEIPLVISILGVVMLVGSLSLVSIVEAQRGGAWFLWKQPLGFFIFFIAGLAELNRSPFDIPEAESELTAGYHTEYSGMKFSMFFLAEYTNMFTAAALGTTLFLGGWLGPAFLPPWFWFFLKTYGLIFVMMWFRWTFPRFRMDQLMALGWKLLLPLALANVLVTGLITIR